MKTEPARKAPKPPPRGEARSAILDAALGLVRRQGWAATSVDQLCEAAGVSKGAFFHHFASKDALGVAAAERWTEVTSRRFASAEYHQLADPLERIQAYLALRAALASGPLEAFTCFAGTTVQEAFATSEPVRAACGASILGHASQLAADFQAAIEAYPPRLPVTAESLALFTQTVLQGGFVLAKAKGDRTPVIDAIAHLSSYLQLIFGAHAPGPGQPSDSMGLRAPSARRKKS
jgi:TetR/AcrR family transcriptional repressor of nem operon